MKSIYLAIRRACDIVLAAGLLIILTPLLILVSIAIFIGMGRPIFFLHERQGHRGKFSIIKFRTMIRDAEKIGGGYFTKEVNLVPPIGALLRKTSIDELPQLVNILKGDMSFVGPRPAIPTQVERYTEEQKMRLSVPQGVTGLAQLRYRNNAPWSVRIESDLEYVRKLGPLMDLRILLLTPSKVIRGTGVRMDQTPEQVDDLGK